MAYNDRELLARLIKCEAGGEGESGMKGVATVVMNRVDVSNGEYQRVNQGSMRNVITQPGEFTCLMPTVNGQVNPQTIWSSPPEQIHYDIADWALGGNRLWAAGDSLWYYNPYVAVCANYFPPNQSGSYYNRIYQHCFYLPTPLYATT